jgi:hypothetical protein
MNVIAVGLLSVSLMAHREPSSTLIDHRTFFAQAANPARVESPQGMKAPETPGPPTTGDDHQNGYQYERTPQGTYSGKYDHDDRARLGDRYHLPPRALPPPPLGCKQPC